jgi:signal transduction protein with GAF and PtsI domain
MSAIPSKESIIEEIEKVLQHQGTMDPAFEAILEKVLAAFDCPVGSIHTMDSGTGMLRMRARRGIPDVILDKVKMIPIGKGMAGIAAERKQPVQVCNLQTDDSGVAKPGARNTQMEGSIAVPMIHEGILTGVIGVAKPITYEFNQDETDSLLSIGRLVASYLK